MLESNRQIKVYCFLKRPHFRISAVYYQLLDFFLFLFPLPLPPAHLADHLSIFIHLLLLPYAGLITKRLIRWEFVWPPAVGAASLQSGLMPRFNRIEFALSTWDQSSEPKMARPMEGLGLEVWALPRDFGMRWRRWTASPGKRSWGSAARPSRRGRCALWPRICAASSAWSANQTQWIQSINRGVVVTC